MGTLHRRRLHGFVLLLVLFLFSVSSLASRVSSTGSNNSPPSKTAGASEYTMCSDTSEAEGRLLPPDLGCDKGDVISAIKFADYGQATGVCGTYKRGKCGGRNTLNIVKKKCIGKQKCELLAPDKIFGPSHCKGTIRLAIEATCKKT